MREIRIFSGLVESEASGLARLIKKVASYTFHHNYSIRKVRDKMWLNRVVLVPQGDPETQFVFGFYLPGLGARTFTSAVRRVSDGSFAMLDCPSQSFYYAIGNAPIKLLLESQFLAGSEEETNLMIDLY